MDADDGITWTNEPEIISELDKIAERIRTFDAIVTDESGKEIVDFSTHFFSGSL